MLSYPVRFIPTDEGVVLARLVDIPEVVGLGPNEDVAIEAARVVLEAVLGNICADGAAIPNPSDICGAPVVTTEKFSLEGRLSEAIAPS